MKGVKYSHLPLEKILLGQSCQLQILGLKLLTHLDYMPCLAQLQF